MYDKKIFSDNLQFYMKKHGENQVDVANLLGISKSNVSSYIKGEQVPRMDKIALLCDHYGIQVSDLLETKKAPSGDGAEEFERAVNLLFSEHPENLSRLLDALAADPEKTKAKFDLFLATL